MWRRRGIELADGTVAGLEFGPADRKLDVVFLHANGFNAMTYRQALHSVGETMRVLAVDMRGHGRSTLPVPDSAGGWQLYADDLVALVEALGERPRILAGHSMGGTTALLAAPRLGSVRLVLFDPVLAPPESFVSGAGPDWNQPLAAGALRRKDYFADRDAAWVAYHGRGAFKTWPDAALADYLEDGLRPVADGFALACAPRWEAANFAGYCVTDPYPALAACAAGVRVLRAESGSTCFVEPERCTIVPGTTHFLPMERPDIVAAALREEELLF